ncbi:MAG: phosphotransferase [Gammaproteobacteria bacterium]|nr:phosphotransferase [Gammaproteobacteria bacterium]
MNTFKQNIVNIYKEKGETWLDNLPQLTQKISLMWNLTDLHPVNNLSYNYVLSGFQNKLPIILKLSPENIRLNKESAALKAFAGYGVANILNQTDGALLLECAVPGDSLKNYFPDLDKEATDIFCKVMYKLHQAPIPQNHQLPHISNWLSALDKDWDISLEKARTLKKHLLETAGPDTLLHGDLHHENVLKNSNDWMVIDPKGVIGEAAYELGAFIRNPMPNLFNTPDPTSIIQNRITLCTETLNLDKSRITQWCFVQSVLGHIWCLEDNMDPEYFIELSKIFAKLT